MWHMCALHEQPQRTDQNLMQDELVERSVLGLYEHGTVAGTTLVCCMVCELQHSGVLQGGLQGIQQCVLCRLRLALALQIEAHPAVCLGFTNWSSGRYNASTTPTFSQ